MPNNRRINLKDIKKKDTAHPYSRRAKQISRAIQRTEKVNAYKSRPLTGPQALKCDKFSWFKYAVGDDAKPQTLEEVRELIDEYLKREFEDIDLKKPSSFKEDIRKAQHLAERQEYLTSGLEIPDLMCAKSIKLLREWDGDWNGISRVKVKKINAPSAKQ
ncbi:translation machinery-associated protein 16, variant 2 [Entomophthora muscae]|uniref:Translation machinery-associated protein 16, variant 2 n=1 Tax=Entomophthora muscae TaxID=34485 RepID=A0ACC2UMQ2_9FUNG|nr:translation machinery-associated protein 16, variant 2 [Entomophthora muscae]